MSRTDMNMKITDANGKSSTTKISYVNPNASDNQLVTLATKLNELTTNTLDEASRVTTTELSLVAKQEREDFDIEGGYFKGDTLTLSEITTLMNDDETYIIDGAGCPVQPDGKAPYIDHTQTTSQFPASYYVHTDQAGSGNVFIIGVTPAKLKTFTDNSINLVGKIVCKIDESDTYKGYTCTITITE